MEMVHYSPVGGLSGILVTTKKISELVYWKGMRKDVQNFIDNCDVCKMNKSENVRTLGMLQPLDIPNRLWEDISMDFIEALPHSYGKTVIWVVVDRLSKYAHLLPLAHPYTASIVASLFMEHIYKLHGMPLSIVSDQDPVFTRNFWQELFKLSKVKLCFSSAYHPQLDGQTEVVNR